ncbi:MAG: hypothetical protein JXL84_14080 [Deltaproteobacteria bacterium]|nr:hypothetical protein [Deltaproteobacteria bacterium]
MNRRRVAAALLLLLPLMIYANTIFARFGFRDDYSILRETNEEPGKVLMLCSSHARPLYGWMLENFFGNIEVVDDLWAGRALGALFLGGYGLLLYLGLLRLGWPAPSSALLGALMTMLPAAQVNVSWAICWPHLMAGLFGISGFLVADRGGVPARLGGGALVAVGALFYQPDALLYVVLVAAGLLTHRAESVGWRMRWITKHLLTVGLALAADFLLMQVLYAVGLFYASSLTTLETDLLAKLEFFLSEPLPNALALLVLNDMRDGTSTAHTIVAASVTSIILLGGWGEIRRAGWQEGAFWAASLTSLCFAAWAVSLVASLRWPTYRTLFPLMGVILVFLVLGLQHIGGLLRIRGHWLVPVTLAGMVTVAAPLASWNAFTLFALPQEQELALVEEGVQRLRPKRRFRVFVIRPTPEDAPAPGFYGDEFGSLSSDSDWTPGEMFNLALRKRYPSLRGLYGRVKMECGYRMPLSRRFDLVIDMRRLREHRRALVTHGFLLF